MNPWIAIVGRREDGRERVTLRLWHMLAAGGTRVVGFVQDPVHVDGEHVGYDVFCPSNGERAPLARVSDDALICNWGFDEAGWASARRWSLRDPGDVCFIEAGRREAAQEGHWSTLIDALVAQPLTILSIRPSVLASIAIRLPDPVDALELPNDDAAVEAFLTRVHMILRARQTPAAGSAPVQQSS